MICKAKIDNSLFGNYNPYSETIDGDWFMSPIDKFLHTGAVYINGKVLDEISDKNEFRENSWYCEVNDKTTVI